MIRQVRPLAYRLEEEGVAGTKVRNQYLNTTDSLLINKP